MREEVALCGDGVPSNGPPTVNPFTQQDSGTEGFEACDDGNSVDGDGCTNCQIDVGYECPIWGQPCNPICGNGFVEADGVTGVLDPILRITQSDTDTPEIEECDLGALNIGTSGTSDDYACTADCKVTDKSKWRCTKVSDGAGRWTSVCEWLCGNQKVDIQEDDGQYINDQSMLGTYTDMAVKEECDIGQWKFEGQTKNGYYGEIAGFDTNPKTNTNMLLGCTTSCTVEPTFRCPDAADVAANDNWALATCTDRCGDGFYDGPYPEVGRPDPYPTCITKFSPTYPTSDFTCFIDGTDYKDRILTE